MEAAALWAPVAAPAARPRLYMALRASRLSCPVPDGACMGHLRLGYAACIASGCRMPCDKQANVIAGSESRDVEAGAGRMRQGQQERVVWNRKIWNRKSLAQQQSHRARNFAEDTSEFAKSEIDGQ